MECIFCKIIKKEIPAKIVYEDNFALAFLDINPRSKGMTIVVPKKHYQNFDQDLQTSLKTYEAAQKVALKIKKALNPKAILFSILPSQIPHFHIRIYPITSEKEIPLIENRPIPIKPEELDSLASKIKSVRLPEEISIIPKKEEKKIKEEKEKEEKRSEEEIFWVKRELEIT